MVRKIPKWLKNKYTLAAIIFVVWITFFDRNDLITQVGYVAHLHELRHQEAYLQGQIDTTSTQLHQLLSDPQRLQQFAREEYLMKRRDEDVFLIRQPTGR